MRGRWCIGIVLAALAVPAGAQGPAQAPQRQRPPGFQVTSTVVQLVLRATHRGGRPVTDLRRSQIEVLDDGHPGRIVAFRPAWKQAPAQEISSVAGQPRPAPPLAKGIAPARAPGPPRYLGFVIDLTASQYAIRQDRLAIAKFVRSGRARGRPLALFAVGEQGLMLIPFTADRGAFLNRLARCG